MFILALLFVLGAASAALKENEVRAQQSFLDIYANYPGYYNLDIYQGPVLVLAPVSEGKGPGVVAYYADNGLRSIVDYQKFHPLLRQLQSSPYLSGLILTHQVSNSFILNNVQELILPENFKLFDFLRYNPFNRVPILYLAPREIFDSQHFGELKHVKSYVLNEFSIDPVVGFGNNNGLADQRPPNYPLDKQYPNNYPYKEQNLNQFPYYNQFDRQYPYYNQFNGQYPYYNQFNGQYPYYNQFNGQYPYYNKFNGQYPYSQNYDPLFKF